MSWVFFLWFSELKWEVIVHFVDIDGVVDHYCINFIFINSGRQNTTWKLKFEPRELH